MEPEEATGYLAGIFSTMYVGFEVAMKLLQSLILHIVPDHGNIIVFSTYTAAAVISSFFCSWIRDPSPPDRDTSAGALFKKKLMAAMELWTQDKKIWTLAPMNITFGFTAAYMNFYMNGIIAKESIGSNNIGFLISIIPGYAAVMSLPYQKLGNMVGKCPMMILGAICWISIAVIGIILKKSQLIAGGWTVLIVLYLLMGSGRCVFESTNKAVFADFFPRNMEGAFANLIVQNGLSSTIGFFIFPYMSSESDWNIPWVMPIIIGFFGLLAILGLIFGFVIYRQEQTQAVNSSMTYSSLDRYSEVK